MQKNYEAIMSTPQKSAGPPPPTAPSSSVSSSQLDFDYDIDDNSPAKSVEMKRDESPETRIVGTRYSLDDTANIHDNAGYHEVGNSNPKNQKPTKIKVSKSTYIFVSCAALNSCNLGYDIGVNTSVAKLLKDGDSLALSDRQLEIFMGSINLFAAVGAIFASTISDRFGRRGAFIVAAVGFIFGVLLQAVANSYTTLMAGRVFVGLGVGFGLAIDPIYIAEISPSRHRGRLVTWSELAINVGIVFGFASGLVFYDVEPDLAWRLMFSCGIILPTLLIYFVINIMPESPRWLISNGREDEAKLVLEKVYPVGCNIDDIVTEIKEGIKREARAERKVGWDMLIFPTPAVRRMLMVGVGSAIAQQLVGIDAIQYFLEFILEEAGLEEGRPRILTLIGLGILKLVVIVFAGKAFDKRGRRPFLFTSLLGERIFSRTWIVAFFSIHISTTNVFCSLSITFRNCCLLLCAVYGIFSRES